jgi:hypothetical protein
MVAANPDRPGSCGRDDLAAACDPSMSSWRRGDAAPHPMFFITFAGGSMTAVTA